MNQKKPPGVPCEVYKVLRSHKPSRTLKKPYVLKKLPGRLALAIKSMLQLENYGVELFRIVYPATVDHPLCTRLTLPTYHQKRWASFRVVVSHHLVSLKCRWILINDISFIYGCHGFVHQPVGLRPYRFSVWNNLKLA